MRALACLVFSVALLAAGCRSWPIETTDLTIEPGGRVHVHGKALHVKVLSRGPGSLTISLQDAEGRELSGAALGVGRWTGGHPRATDAWIRNGSESVVNLDVRARGSGTVAVATLEKPVEPR